MKVLVISNTPWDDNNSFGNSYSNIFGGMEDIEFANVYCRSGVPNNDISMKCFQITTGAVAKSIINKNVVTGKQVEKQRGVLLSEIESKAFTQASKYRWIILFWIRELIWKLGEWRSRELQDFIDDFKPDIIFQPVYGQGLSYISRIGLWAKKYTGCQMFGYVSDDVYSFHQFSFSPLYWADRFLRHKLLRQLMCSCSILYVISETQKEEYEKMLHVPCKVLTKGIPDLNVVSDEHSYQKPYRLIFAGNIGEDRWKTLGMIGRALDECNQSTEIAVLYLYTRTPLSEKMKAALACKSIKMMGSVDVSRIKGLYQQSDILVHVESFGLRGRMSVHQSFSTKLVDYFEIGRCIFAVGPDDVASMAHLMKHDAAITVTDPQMLTVQLKKLLNNVGIMQKYAEKAKLCGEKHHSLTMQQEMLRNDFLYALEDNK